MGIFAGAGVILVQLKTLGADTHFGKAQGPWGMWRGCGQKDNERHVRGMSCRGSGEVCRVCSYLLQQLCFTKPAWLLCIPAGKPELTNEHAHEKTDMEIELLFSRFKSLHFLNVKVFSLQFTVTVPVETPQTDTYTLAINACMDAQKKK